MAERAPVVLAYHQVERRVDFAWNRVSPERLERQMAALARRGWTGTTLAGALEGAPGRNVAITFDDALAGVVDYALPVLRRFGFRATLFAPTAWIGRQNLWDSRLVGRRARHADARALRLAAEAGWEIGSHGHTHRDLSLLSEEEVGEELETSRREIAAAVGEAPRSIAYPFGSADEKVVRAAGRAGFRWGCLAVPRRWEGDGLRIGRVGVRRFDVGAEFLSKVEGGPLFAWQAMKDRIAHGVSLGVPRVKQRIWKVDAAC